MDGIESEIKQGEEIDFPQEENVSCSTSDGWWWVNDTNCSIDLDVLRGMSTLHGVLLTLRNDAAAEKSIKTRSISLYW